MKFVVKEPIKHTPIIYYFRPDRWIAFLMGKLKRLVDWYHQGDIDSITYAEQVVYRRQICPSCDIKNESQCCKCPFREKILQKNEKCGFDMWPEMMNRKEWLEFKKENNINIFI